MILIFEFQVQNFLYLISILLFYIHRQPIFSKLKRGLDTSTVGQFHAEHDFLNDRSQANLSKLTILVDNEQAATRAYLTKDVRIRTRLSVTLAGWGLEVTDRGGGDPDEVRPFLDPEGLPDLENERGRGFFLLAQSVDALTVDLSPDGDGLIFCAERRYASGPEA